MDIVYAHSVYTIMAHSSVDASSSILGIRPNMRQPLRLVSDAGAGKGIVFSASLCHYSIRPSVYDPCGWTFQEQVFSHPQLRF